MLAAYHVAPNRLELCETPLPALEPGEALIRVRACAFCGSDRHDLARAPGAPRVPGHEFSGAVERLAGEASVSVGDPVCVDPIVRCGRCDYCLSGRDHLCRSMSVVGCQTPGGFAEFAKAPIANLRPKPPVLSFEAATLADPLAVALHATGLAPTIDRARCLVLGAGTIGLLMAQVLRLHGAREVWLADIEEGHLALARGLGPFGTVNLATQPTEALPDECDLAVELAGGEALTLDLAIASLRKGGTALCIAQRPPSQLPYPTMLFSELRLQGVFGQRSADFAEAISLLGNGQIRGEPLISDRFPLREVQAALDRFLEASSVKVVVVLDAG
jgi:(R,R)-butanediol dehydrogenase/meso-butanediol dehydrogenase/diacetyl reductase